MGLHRSVGERGTLSCRPEAGAPAPTRCGLRRGTRNCPDLDGMTSCGDPVRCGADRFIRCCGGVNLVAALEQAARPSDYRQRSGRKSSQGWIRQTLELVAQDVASATRASRPAAEAIAAK